MIFQELILENFGPYKGRQVIDLSTEFDDELRPIVLIGGMNGEGKTTLMDAIRLVFYGQRAQCSTRGNLSYKDFLVQCVNHQVKAPEVTRVELAFSHVKENENVVFRVRRTWTKYLKDGQEDQLEVITDKWLDETITKTWDERVEYILPLGISNLFLFDGEQVKELAEQDSPPLQVVEAIKSLLGLELAERLSADLDILMARKRKEIADEKQREKLEALEREIEELEQEREGVSKEIKSLKQKVKEKEETFTHHNQEFMTQGGAIASNRKPIDQERKKWEQSWETERQTLRKLAGDILPLGLIQPLLQEAIDQGEMEIKHSTAVMTKAVITERDRRLVNYLQGLALPENKVTQIKDFLQQENQDLEKAIDPKVEPWLGIDEETLSNLKTTLINQFPPLWENAQKTCDRIQEIEEEITTLDKQLQSAASPETYNTLKTARDDAEKALISAKTDLETQQRRFNTLDTRITEVKKTLDSYSRTAIDQFNKEHLLDSATRVQETLKLFRERLTLKKLNKLEIEVTECFRYLLRKSHLVHRVTITTDDFRLSLYNLKGELVPKHRLSAGEKQILAIAFLWGLARVSGRQLPIAIDTPLGRLDSSHRHNLVERYFTSASSQVILLSTDTEIGQNEVEQLRDQDAIAHEYCLSHDPKTQETTIQRGYFW